jgi:hypothetical protein
LSLKQKRLLLEAARHRAIFSFWEILGAFFEQLGSLFVKIVTNITVVLVVILLLLGIVGLSSALDSVDKFVENQQKIKNLKIAVKNLKRNYEVAKIKILNYDYNKRQTTFEVYFYDFAQKKYLPNKQVITMKGSQIYLLSLVINFDYSEIETGERINLALPYKVFSDQIESRNGIPLQVLDSSGIPFIYHRTEEQLYGIDSLTYYVMLHEIATYISNPKAAKKAGVKSILAAAPHNIKYPRRGQVYTIYVEQTGGLTIKQEERF